MTKPVSREDRIWNATYLAALSGLLANSGFGLSADLTKSEGEFCAPELTERAKYKLAAIDAMAVFAADNSRLKEEGYKQY